MKRLPVPLLTFVLVLIAAVARSDDNLPPIKRLNDAKPLTAVFKDSTKDKPIVIRSATDVARYFSAPQAVQLSKQVDFNDQVVLVFAWRGSGQDRIEYDVLESFPEQIVFQLKPGRTRDLRPHVVVYAVRSNVRWRTGATSSDARPEAKAQYILVEVRGELDSHVIAIGGETTGTVIRANGVTWELDLAGKQRLRQLAKQLHKQTVVIKGTLHMKAGVEIKRRWIVTVESLEVPQPEKGANHGILLPNGSLQHTLVLRDAQTGFAGDSGHVWTIEPDGSWRHQTFLNANARVPDQTGTLSKKQLASIAQHLTKTDFLALPPQVGKDPGVNPHTFTITFGKEQRQLILTGGAPIPKPRNSGDNSPEQRFGQLVYVLQELLKP